MDKRTAGALIALLIMFVILLNRPIESSKAGNYHPVIQLYLLATALLIAVGIS